MSEFHTEPAQRRKSLQATPGSHPCYLTSEVICALTTPDAEPTQDEHDFRLTAQAALDSLKRRLIQREPDQHAAFEVEQQDRALSVLFEHSGSKFVIAPNVAARQIQISAQNTDFLLDWDSRTEKFIFSRTGENLGPLVDRLISEHQ
jgi:hypothetical protein